TTSRDRGRGRRGTPADRRTAEGSLGIGTADDFLAALDERQQLRIQADARNLGAGGVVVLGFTEDADPIAALDDVLGLLDFLVGGELALVEAAHRVRRVEADDVVAGEARLAGDRLARRIHAVAVLVLVREPRIDAGTRLTRLDVLGELRATLREQRRPRLRGDATQGREELVELGVALAVGQNLRERQGDERAHHRAAVVVLERLVGIHVLLRL